MDSPTHEASSQTILRLAEVVRRTGLSRSTLYLRIADGAFPRQISLGKRAIGWLKDEVDDWINARTKLRTVPPDKVFGIASELESSTVADRGYGQGKTGNPDKPGPYSVSVSGGAPVVSQLSLVSTAVYFDKIGGFFWLKLVAEDPCARKRRRNP